MRIMIAAPCTSGGADTALRAARLAEMNQAALAVLRLGHVPLIAVNMALPIIAAAEGEACDEAMTPLSPALAEHCDAVLRMLGQDRARIRKWRASGRQAKRSMLRRRESRPPE